MSQAFRVRVTPSVDELGFVQLVLELVVVDNDTLSVVKSPDGRAVVAHSETLKVSPKKLAEGFGYVSGFCFDDAEEGYLPFFCKDDGTRAVVAKAPSVEALAAGGGAVMKANKLRANVSR